MTGFVRALAGALLFSLPLLMTMELWELAVSVDRWRLVLLAVSTVLLTAGLTHSFGAVDTPNRWRDAAVDAGVAVLAGVLVAVAVLTLLQVVNPIASWQDAIAIITVEALPASLGAAFARGQLGERSPRPRTSSYLHQLFLMMAGAVVFSANLAPTEEIVLLAATMGQSNGALMICVGVVLIHALVYGSGFAGEEDRGSRRTLLVFSVPGYAIALVVSAFMLWTFGRFDGTGTAMVVMESVVLSLPSCIGAGAARLIL